MSALTTPSTWLVQSVDLTVLPVDDLYILATGIFISANTKFERRLPDSVVVKLSYSTKLETFTEKFGDYKEDIRVVPLSVHHSDNQSSRFLELISKKRVYSSSPQQEAAPSGNETNFSQPGNFNVGSSTSKRFRKFV